MKALTFVEIDIDYCSLTYGVAPCSAAIGVTGSIKCFNCVSTCQDRESFNNVPVTLRFALPTEYLPPDIACIPSIRDVAFTPGVASLGEDLGTRSTLSVTLEDHPWSDTRSGFDKYHAERGYDPFRQGTFWGKFRARQPYLRGRPIRIIRGLLGQSLDEMEVRHFVIESFDGPTPDGKYTLTAKDVLKLADGDRAQAPRLSNGFLAASRSAGDTSATLSPSGIGNLEYPASGYVAIGGKEICAFTRSGDTLTLTRGQLGTVASAHDLQDRVQLVLVYTGIDPANIIADLLENYADVPAGFIPLTSWLDETEAFVRRLYTGVVAEPTSVNTLVSEIIEQAGLVVWWSDTDQEIKLQVLRAIPTTAALFTEDNTLEGSLSTKEQPDKRLSQVWTYFGKRNPLGRQDDPDNYRSTAASVDLEAETDYGTPAIKKIFSRWIPAFGRPVALRLNDILLGRFRDPPRRFNFSIFPRHGEAVQLGGGYRIQGWSLQDATGAVSPAPVQVTRLKPEHGRIDAEGEEMLFVEYDEEDADNRTIIIDTNSYNLNIRSIYDTIYTTPVSGDEVSIIIETDVKVGSTSTSLPAIDMGSWPAGVLLTLTNRGRIQGKGGRGGGTNGNAQAGGPALYTRFAIDVDNTAGEIFGGGGGGEWAREDSSSSPRASGGGGAGYDPGLKGSHTSGGFSVEQSSQDGTTEEGGRGMRAFTGFVTFAAGAGGAPGAAGGSVAGPSGPSSPGAAGAAVDGDSYVTFTVLGDVRGPRIN